MNSTEEKEQSTEKTPAYSYYALGLLMLVYIINFLDRQIIFILFPAIKKEMAFTDLELALLGGTSFAIFYTLLGIPFGRLADRKSRTKIIAIGLAIWSVFSGLTGFAGGFWEIFFCRVMVGVGEATLGPAAISLLADFFPPARRATVTSIYSMGIAIGAGFAALFGGYLSEIGWREAFFIVGFPGVIPAVLVYVLREPKRSQAPTDNKLVGGDWRKLVTNPAFVMLCIGFGFFGLATNNVSIWGATYFNRVLEIDIPTYGFWAGIATLGAGIPATLFGGMIADGFRKRSRGGRMLFASVLSLASAFAWMAVLFSGEITVVIIAGVFLLFAALSWLGAAAADATEIAGVELRGLSVAIYFFTVNIAAYLIGGNLIGLLSDVLGGTNAPESLRYALLVCPIACVLGAIALFSASRTLNREASTN
jgi:MFS family permease